MAILQVIHKLFHKPISYPTADYQLLHRKPEQKLLSSLKSVLVVHAKVRSDDKLP